MRFARRGSLPATPPTEDGLGGFGPVVVVLGAWRDRAAAAIGMIEGVLRRPFVAMAAVSLMAMVVTITCSERARPVWAGCSTALVVGLAGPWLLVAAVRGQVAFDRERCRVGERVGMRAALRGVVGWILGGHRGYFVRWPAGSGVCAGRLHDSPTGVGAEMTMLARGLQPSHDPRICCDWPFGLVTAWRPIGVIRPIVVRPLAWRLPLPSAVLSPSRHGRQRSEGARGSSGDTLGVREYRRGDDPRSVHWVHTARRGTLVVRERPGHGLPVIRLLLAAVEATLAELDTISAVATSVIESWVGQGVELEVAWGKEQRYAVQEGRLLDPLLDAIACVDGPGLMPPGGELARLACRKDLRAGNLDLEVIVTNPTLAAEGREAGTTPRLWIVVSATTVQACSDSPRSAGWGGREWRVVVPAGEWAADVLVKTLAEVGHDPDAVRG